MDFTSALSSWRGLPSEEWATLGFARMLTHRTRSPIAQHSDEATRLGETARGL
jgi:hypothetical protein